MLISDDGRKLAFTKRELLILTSMMAKEERPALAALWFHGGKAQAWATDGSRAVLVEHEAKPPRGDRAAPPVAIPAATAHHVAKTARPRDLVVVDTSGARVSIDVRAPHSAVVPAATFEEIETRTYSKHAVTCKRHEGGHPTIEHVFPSHHKRGSKGAAAPVNPALLGPVLMLATVSGHVWINVDTPLDPVLFVARADGLWWRMLVMPLRPGSVSDIEPPTVPAPAPVPPASPAPEPASPVAQPAAPEPAKPRRGRRPRGSAAA